MADDRPIPVKVALVDALLVGQDRKIPVDAVATYMAQRMEELFREYGDDRFRNAADALVPPPPKALSRTLMMYLPSAGAMIDATPSCKSKAESSEVASSNRSALRMAICGSKNTRPKRKASISAVIR